ncbi:MAG: dockerin type I repeat-containing protein [Ruminococcus sp.]|nr:dockerin type I repeat-containing protein [Ruminococcus sp.]
MAKRIWAVILAIVILFACSAVVLAAEDDLEIMPATFAIGDVNMDKDINIKDATVIQKYIAKLETLSDIQLFLADADLDGNVNIKDATYIQKQVAGLVKPAVPTFSQETTVIFSSEPQPIWTEEGTTQLATVVTDPTESAGTTVPETTTAPTEPEVTSTSAQLTDPTESPTTEVPATQTTPTQTEETTAQVATRDPNKPIELPFIPAK